MAHTSKIFTKLPVDIPNRSGFDMSHENMGTLQCGTLIPILCEEVIPNETYNIGHLTQIQLPPMATDFFGRIDARIEAFFVPNRIIWGGWQNFITMPVHNPFGNPTVRPTSTPGYQGSVSGYLSSGTLADYLGYKVVSASGVSAYLENILPFLAYHKIWDDWYRNKLIQKPLFSNTSGSLAVVGSDIHDLGGVPWYPGTFILSSAAASPFVADGSTFFSLRQRNWAKDYFTTAALYPQASGDIVGSSVEFAVNENSGQISIPALRSANVLQRWMDRNNIAGFEYSDQIKAHFGTLPADAIMNRAIFLGSDVIGVYNRSVYTTAPTSRDVSQTTSRNPFAGSVGSKAASAAGFKDGNLVDNFKTTEHGYIMVLLSLVPHAYYSTGIRRQLFHTVPGDYAFPLLQGLGEQPIYRLELQNLANFTEMKGEIFGYQQQYSEYKYHDDEVHGLLRDGESLENFALQRSFDQAPELGTDFLQIPKDYLDQVFALASDVSGFSGWYDTYISMRKVSPLSEYVIPTLGDLKNTHKETIDYRGRML